METRVVAAAENKYLVVMELYVMRVSHAVMGNRFPEFQLISQYNHSVVVGISDEHRSVGSCSQLMRGPAPLVPACSTNSKLGSLKWKMQWKYESLTYISSAFIAMPTGDFNCPFPNVLIYSPTAENTLILPAVENSVRSILAT